MPLLPIPLFLGYHAAYSAFGVFDITFVAGDKVHVDVEDGLSCCGADVDANVVAVGVVALVQCLLYGLQHKVHVGTLGGGEVEVTGNMTLGYDESVPGRNRVSVVKGDACGCFANYLSFFVYVTKDAIRFLWVFHRFMVLKDGICRLDEEGEWVRGGQFR